MMLLAVAVSAVSCQWRDLDYEFIDTARITIIYNWEQSGLRTKANNAAVNQGDFINGRTAAFYPMNGGDPVIKMSHSDTVTVNLLVGQYAAVFFNETFDDFDNIRFTGTESFDLLEAWAKDDIVATTRANSTIARQPDILAVESMVPFEVTEDMVRYTRIVETRKSKGTKNGEFKSDDDWRSVEEAMTVETRPRSVVKKVVIDVNVEGLDNVAVAGGYVSGFAGGYDFSLGRQNSTSVSHKITFTDQEFLPDSDTDGVLRSEFQCFGYRDGISVNLSGYTFDFRAVLVNGEVYQEQRDIDELITEVEEDGSIVLHITIGTHKGGTGSGDDEDAPIKVPEVERVGGDGMWLVNVGDWDEIVVPIDMNM